MTESMCDLMRMREWVKKRVADENEEEQWERIRKMGYSVTQRQRREREGRREGGREVGREI